MKKPTLAAMAALTTISGAACVDLTDYEHGDYFSAPGVSVTTSGRWEKLQVFDSNLSGTHDPDLEVGLGNLLIISESPRRVDDKADGGTISIRLPEPSDYLSLTMVDLDEPATFVFYHESGPPTLTPFYYTSDGGVLPLEFKMTYTGLDIILTGSGAIAEYCDTPAIPEPKKILLSIFGILALIARRNRQA